MKYICLCGNFAIVSEAKYRNKIKLYCSQCQDMTDWVAIEWPYVQPNTEIWFNGDTYWYAPDEDLCFYCKTNKTHWLSLSFEGALCSPVCAESAWQEYFGAN